MKFIFYIHLLFSCFSIFHADETRRRADESEEKTCAFYCFLVKNTCDKLNSTDEIEPYKSLSCTHMVYGFAVAERSNWTLAPSWWDSPDGNNKNGNAIVSSLRNETNMTMLMGFFDSGELPFINTSEIRKSFAKEIVKSARSNGFQGIFFFTQLGDKVFDEQYVEFIKILKTETNAESGSKERLKLVLSFGTTYAIDLRDSFKDYASYFDALYLRSDETASRELNKFGTFVDPLNGLGANLPLQTIAPEETISKATQKLIDSGVPRQKIIVGLSAWTNSFWVDGDTARKLNDSITGRTDGKLAYYEVCQLRNESKLVADDVSKTMAFNADNVWYSLNLPGHRLFEEKINWVVENKFGGIGLTSLKADDQYGICQEGPFPIHQYVGNHFQCNWNVKLDQHGNPVDVKFDRDGNPIEVKFDQDGNPIKIKFDRDGNPIEVKFDRDGNPIEVKFDGDGNPFVVVQKTKEPVCTRICVINPEYAPVKFSLENMEPNWCSHIVVSSAILANTPLLSPKSQKLIEDYRKWKVRNKPKLIISIGANEPTENWRAFLLNKVSRQILIDGIKKLLSESKFDGVDVSWTKNNLISPRDTEVFSLFMEELRKSVPENYTIAAEITPQTTFNERYDFFRLNNSVDYIIAHGHRFHSYQKSFTGHHSPLFMTEDLVDVRMTIEGYTSELVKRGMPKEKIIIGLTAEAMGMRLMVSERGTSKVEIGAASSTFNFVRRSISPGTISQTEVCLSLRKNSTQEAFISKIGIPYLIDNSDFIAFDDTRSIRLKSIWESMHNYGGIALFGIEMDNVDGECPENKTYPILKTIVNTQTCNICPRQLLAQNATNSTEMCIQPAFHVFCSYQLSRENGIHQLEPFEIPYKKCTDIVVEKAILNKNGDLLYETSTTDSLQKLVKFQPQNKIKTKLIAGIECEKNMSEEEFRHMIEDQKNLFTKLIDHMKLFGFGGVEFRCDHLVTPNTKASFAKMLNSALDYMESLKESDTCQKTIGIRVKIQNNLTESYNVTILNKLNTVVIDTSPTPSKVSKILNPLFEVGPGGSLQTLESTIKNWMDSGVDSRKISFVIPSYGVRQKYWNENITGLGERVHDSFELINQEQVCTDLKQPGFTDKIPEYEVIGAYATNTLGNEFMTYETRETVDYKFKYALRENLGGLSFDYLNYDDFENKCNTGLFPLLEAIDLSKCSV